MDAMYYSQTFYKENEKSIPILGQEIRSCKFKMSL